MERITAEEALEAAKGLNFEKVWAALMESRQLIEKSQQETQKQIEETQKQMEETQRQIKESQQETQRQMQESQRQIKKSQRKTDKIIADLSKNIGGLGNSLGKFTEAMFSTELWKKFNDIGFTFTKQAPRMKFYEDGRALVEVDFFLENGLYAMPVEIKTELSVGDVDDHLERIEKNTSIYG